MRIRYLAAVTALLAAAAAPSSALGAGSNSLTGTVTAAGHTLAGARVTLFAGSGRAATAIGHATSDSAGTFTISYTRPTAGILYVEAIPAVASKLRLRSVAGFAGGGTPPR